MLVNNKELPVGALSGRVGFKCEISGAPVPDITWYHNRQVINVVENRRYCLIIAEVSTDGSGRYTVVAKNTEGTAQAFVTVRVSGERQACLSHHLLKKSASVPCKVSGNGRVTADF